MRMHALAGSILVACAPVAMGGSSAPPIAAATSALTASGRGTMSFGHEGVGRGLLRFDVTEGDTIPGSLTYAAEHHHAMFPDIVVTLGTFENLRFKDRSVEFSGPGRLHDDPVRVAVRADDRGDGKGRGRPDRFVITCTDPASGLVVFEADGELFRGDIRVGDGTGGRP